MDRVLGPCNLHELIDTYVLVSVNYRFDLGTGGSGRMTEGRGSADRRVDLHTYQPAYFEEGLS